MKIKGGEKRYYTNDRFHVREISYDGERTIRSVSIANSKNQMVYSMDLGENGSDAAIPEKPESMKTGITEEQMTELEKELKRTGVALDTVLERYKLQSVGQMTPGIYGKAMKSLRNSKNRTAA